MRINNFGHIYYGKEDPELEEKTRRDMIYRVFLGDRQIWVKDEEEELDIAAISNRVPTKWYIIQDFNLNKVTEETNIFGRIDWGDNDLDDEWRSGGSNYHHYTTEGIYEISLICEKSRKNAIIARIADMTPPTEDGYTNELIGIGFGTIPYADNRLGQEGIGVFENVTTIEEVIIPKGLKRVPPRLCYNTKIKKIIFPKYADDDDTKLIIENYAFVSTEFKELWLSSSIGSIGYHGVGYTPNGNVPDNLKIHCVRGTVGASYANQLAAANNTVIIDDEWDERTLS